MAITIEGRVLRNPPSEFFDAFGHMYVLLTQGSSEIVITGFSNCRINPFWGNITTQVGIPIAFSIDARRLNENTDPQTLDIGTRNEDSVWQILIQHGNNIANANLSYDARQNSNSVAVSLVRITGIDIPDPLPNAAEFTYPGSANFLRFDYTLTGTTNTDIIRGFTGNDTFSGGDGEDDLRGEVGDDTLYAAKESAIGADWDDNVSDRLSGGDGFDTYFVAASANFSEPQRAIDFGGVGFNVQAYEHIDIIRDLDGKGAINYAFDAFVSGNYDIGVITSNSNVTWTKKPSQIAGLDVWNGAGSSLWVVVHEYTDPATGKVTPRLVFFDPEIHTAAFAIADFKNGQFGITLDGYTGGTPTNTGDSGNDEISGTVLADVLSGGDGEDFLYGGAGDDIVNGGNGNDWIIGGSGAGDDVYDGGSGRDTIVYSSAIAPITVFLQGPGGGSASGIDIDSDILVSIEDVIGGAGNDNITGSDGDNSLFGGDGNDTIFGNSGNDFIDGGNGADNLNGGDGDDSIYDGGDNANDSLSGGDGNDELIASLGNDTLNGDAGDDFLIGGGGDDNIFGGIGNDTIIGAGDSGNDWFNGGAGIDTVVYSSETGNLTINLIAGTASGGNIGSDQLSSIEDVIAGGGNDTITGNAVANELDGGEGNDFLFGDAGDDTLNGGAGDDFMDGGVGVDTASYADSTADLLVDVNKVAAQTTGEGNDTLRNFENATGGSGNDTLRGNSGANVLDGGDGDDILLGRGGIDTMIGGGGDDRFFVQQAGDTAMENVNGGYDEVRTYVDNYTLPDNIEELRLIANAHVGFGNGLDNLLVGGAGSDELHGGGGNDIINGGGGGDTLFGDAGDDTLRGSSGSDTLNGGDDNDRLEGNDDIDTLNGGAGDDDFFGGGGRDFMTGGTGADRFVFADGDYGGNTFALADRIIDFNQAENDGIDLRTTDADTTTPGDQAFTFLAGVGTAFTGTAGELRFIQSGGRTYVQGDTDGDGTSDFMIRLEGLTTLDAGDFLL